MVSIIIVSHSKLLALGVQELARQMTQGKIQIEIAAGVDDIENPIGTDAVAIMQAIEDVYCSDGVLLMVDMGSAILSAEMALELIDIEQAKNVYICAAPIMEGTMSASIAAAAGMPIAQVLNEAHSALVAKYKLLNQDDFLPCQLSNENVIEDIISDEALEFVFTVSNLHGLHARPSAAIIGTIANFDAEAKLYKGENVANAKSLNSITLLGARLGDTITLKAHGTDAKALISAFSDLEKNNFGDSIVDQQIDEDIGKQLSVSKLEEDGSIAGITVCEGFACGLATVFEQVMPKPPTRLFTTQKIETQRLHEAIEKVSSQIECLRKKPQAGKEHADIFEAHIMMLTDDELLDDITNKIANQQTVERAVFDTFTALAQSFRDTSSEYMQAREADVWDIARQMMFELCEGSCDQELQMTEAVILFAEELSPSNVAKLDPNMTLAICLNGGVSNSHSAILAKALGIPTIVKVDGCLQKVKPGQRVCIDAFESRLWYKPDVEKCSELSLKYESSIMLREEVIALP